MPGPAWIPVQTTDDEVMAIKALAKGEATQIQQRAVLNWLIHRAAGTYELSFRSDGDGGARETAFAEGRRFVGMELVKYINMPSEKVHKEAEN